MPRKPLLRSLLLLALALHVVTARGATVYELLVDRPDQSLRGQKIDLSDRASAARLLAHFGETRLAHEVLTRGRDDDDIDKQIRQLEARLLTELGRDSAADSILSMRRGADDKRVFYMLCLQRARLNAFAGDHTRALGFIALLDDISFPVFDSYKDVVALECYTMLERYDEAIQLGEKRFALSVPRSLTPAFEELLIDAYIKSENYERAVRFIRVVDSQNKRSSAVGPVLIREIELLFEAGDSTASVDRAVDLLHDRRTRSHRVEIARSISERVAFEGLSNETLIELGNALMRGKDLAQVDRIAAILSDRTLSDDEEESLAILIANYYYSKKRYNKAYSQIRRTFTNASIERNATLMRARIFRRTGQALKSAREYVIFAEQYAYDAKAAEALLVASTIYRREGNRDRAFELLDMIAETYPSSRHGRTATMRLANYYIDHKEYSEAVRILEQAVDRTRRENEEMLYYLANAYRTMGKVEIAEELFEELRELDPVSFYLDPAIARSSVQPVIKSSGRVELHGDQGLLAFLKSVFIEREKAYQSIRRALESLPTKDIKVAEAADYLERGREFLAMGFRDWGEAELRALETRYKLPAAYWFELGILYDDFAMHWRSVRAFQRVYYATDEQSRASLRREFKLLAHPVPYPAAVVENCSRNDMPPHLVYGMMRQESLFDLNAVSNAGAMGLMQLMPATSDQVAGRLGFPRGSHENLFVPEINLTFGISYAAHLASRSDGDLIMMLSAYNAGFGNARRWFRQDRSAVVSMVDGIDYTETRNYVKKIVEASQVYHWLYFSGSPGDGGSSR